MNYPMCFYCLKTGQDNPPVGPCDFCKVSVCTRPPVPPNRRGHSFLCTCCGRLVCDYHQDAHTQREHPANPNCFRGPQLATGVTSLQVSGKLLYSQRPPELTVEVAEIQDLSQLLISTLPGAQVMAEVLSRRPSQSWSWDLHTLAHVNEALIQFHPPFFTRTMLAGIFVLATRVVTACWISGVRRSSLLEGVPLSPQQGGILEELAFRVTHSAELSDEIIAVWFPKIDYRHARVVADLVNRLDVPRQPEQIALWIYETDRGTPRASSSEGLLGDLGTSGAAVEDIRDRIPAMTNIGVGRGEEES